MNELTLFQAVELFVLDKEAAGYSRYTIRNYRNTFSKVKAFLHGLDPPLSQMKHGRWAAFFAWLQNDYASEPDGIAYRGKIVLSPKSVCNVHTDLSAFYTWAVKRNLIDEHVIRGIERPRYERPVIEPFTRDEVRRLLQACQLTRTWRDSSTRSQRATAARDRAIILTLLSTGMRVSELCRITLENINFVEQSIKVAGKGRGRDSKERLVYIGRRATRAITRYLAPRLKDQRPAEPLFYVGPDDERRPFSRDVLRRLLKRIGDRAGVAHVYPHRFRHTFAVNYLRNGGDVLTLQALLGHESLDMVRLYVKLAAQDCANVHRSADPVDNWKL